MPPAPAAGAAHVDARRDAWTGGALRRCAPRGSWTSTRARASGGGQGAREGGEEGEEGGDAKDGRVRDEKQRSARAEGDARDEEETRRASASHDGAGNRGRRNRPRVRLSTPPRIEMLKRATSSTRARARRLRGRTRTAPAGSMSRAGLASPRARASRNPLAGVGMILRDPPVTPSCCCTPRAGRSPDGAGGASAEAPETAEGSVDLLAVALESRKMVRDARPSLIIRARRGDVRVLPASWRRILLESQAREAEGDLGEVEEEEAVTAPAERAGRTRTPRATTARRKMAKSPTSRGRAPRPGAGLEKRNVDADADEPTGRVAIRRGRSSMRSSDVIRKVARKRTRCAACARGTRGARGRSWRRRRRGECPTRRTRRPSP